MTSGGALPGQAIEPSHMLGAAIAAVAVGVCEQHAEPAQVSIAQSAARQQHGERDVQQVRCLPQPIF